MGYVSYSRINSSENLPPFQVSIKDGYAIKYDHYWFQKSNIFNVVQVSVAGTVVSIYLTFDILCKHGILYKRQGSDVARWFASVTNVSEVKHRPNVPLPPQ